MADTTNIMGLVAAFIGIAIMLGIGIQILGNTTFDCESLDGAILDPLVSNDTFDSWRGQCETAEDDTQSAYNLLLVILIVIAAVAILFVVRML